MAVCRVISRSTMIRFRKRPCSSLLLMLPRCAIHVRFMKLTGMGVIAWTVLQQLCISVTIHEVIEHLCITLHCSSLEYFCSSLESSLYYERIGFNQSFIHWKDENHTSMIAAGSSIGLTIPDAVCTVLCSWWWAEEPPKTCRAIYRNK